MAKSMTYKSSGVDVDKTNKMVKKIKTMCNFTNRKEVLGKIGNFSGFFNLPRNVKNPVLVGATDGVGTKLMVAKLKNKYDTIGIDLVAMCVNDIITSGAEPLFFLDYFASGNVDPDNFFDVLKGVVKGCKQSNCSLIGGEIAEMPDFYDNKKFDLAGFCTGIVDRKKIIDGSKVKKGDIVIGLASSGLHSNGYSLARKIFTSNEIKNTAWGDLLLRPTKIYVKEILELVNKIDVKSIAHITGGGIFENIPRVIPSKLDVIIDKQSWSMPEIFKALQKKGNVADKEMYRTFNMGLGMVVVVDKKSAERTVEILKKMRTRSWIVGEVIPGKNLVTIK